MNSLLMIWMLVTYTKRFMTAGQTTNGGVIGNGRILKVGKKFGTNYFVKVIPK